MKSMKLVLIGFMGAGKSSVAKGLAEALSLDVYEMDALILARSGRPSIAAIFADDGESHFRALETQVAQELGLLTTGIISTGGGIVGNPENTKALGQGGARFVYLKAAFETLAARVASDASPRPLFADVTAARALYERRLGLYEGCADVVVETDGLVAAAVVGVVLGVCG